MCSHNMGNNWWPVPPLPGWVVSETNTTIIVIIHQYKHHYHQYDQHHEYDHDDDEQVRAGAGVAAPPGAVSAGTGKGLVCRLLTYIWPTSSSASLTMSSSPLPFLVSRSLIEHHNQQEKQPESEKNNFLQNLPILKYGKKDASISVSSSVWNGESGPVFWMLPITNFC